MSRVVLLLVAFVAAVSVASRADRHRPPCGLPKFTEKLDDEKKVALKKIWADYKEGDDDCEDERDKTRDFVKTLTDEERKKVFDHGEGHRRGPHFLRGVSDEVKGKFHDLWQDASISREEKHKKFHDLAQKTLTGKNLEEFEKFEKNMEERKAEWEKKVATLSAPAKIVYDKLQELREQKKKLFADATPEVRSELSKLFGGYHGFRGRFRGRHHEEKKH